MTYADKLLDPRWQKKRLSIFKRDKWKCIECGNSKRTLHVHHLYYKRGREPWDYPMESLQTLCETCHKAKHPPIPESISNPVSIEVGRAYFSQIRKLLS